MGEVYQGNYYRYLPPDKRLSAKSPSNVVGAMSVPGSPNITDRQCVRGNGRPSTCTTIFEDSAWQDGVLGELRQDATEGLCDG